jgi:hypothetical protein
VEAWLMVIVGVLGIAVILTIPACVWYMVVYGLVQIVREKQGKGGPDQPKPAQ